MEVKSNQKITAMINRKFRSYSRFVRRTTLEQKKKNTDAKQKASVLFHNEKKDLVELTEVNTVVHFNEHISFRRYW